jgi:hypothetical protein
MPDPGEKKEAKIRQYEKTVKDYKKENFREKEKKSLTKSIGTAGPKVRPDGTTKDDKPKVTGDPSKDKSKPTAAQKEAFRQQEETYLTKSPGTVGDKYYKNPEGTGTGQGGSGIPKTSSSSSGSGVVTTSTPPMDRPESVAPQTVSDPQDEVIVINLPAQEPTETFTLSGGLTGEDTASIFATDALELDRGNQIPLLLKAFETQTSALSIKPRLSLNKKGTFLRGFDVNFKF